MATNDTSHDHSFACTELAVHSGAKKTKTEVPVCHHVLALFGAK